MFTFSSEDQEDPFLRSIRYRIEIVSYALRLFENNRKKAANYLSISERWLSHYINLYPELHKYRRSDYANRVPELSRYKCKKGQ